MADNLIINGRENLRTSEVARNKEEIQLILLDEKLNDKLSNYNSLMQMLIELNPTAQPYSDFDRCLDFIKSIKYEQIFLIVSDTLVRKVLSYVNHHHHPLVAIFIFCENRQHHQSSIIHDEKIIGVYTDQRSLLEVIRDKMKLVERRTGFSNLFDQKQKSMKDLTKESPSFLWNQVLIFVLKQLPQDQQAKQQLVDFLQDYHRHNETNLKKVQEFNKTYKRDNAIEWYTGQPFLYTLLNKALRTEDVDLILIFRFYLLDLCAQIEKESEHLKDKGILTVYRGTQISNNELEQLKRSIGQTISINGFLSTSKDINVALMFSSPGNMNKGFQRILIEIQADPSLPTVICADIGNISRHQDETEVLFNLSSTFQIHSVYKNEELKLWSVKLITTDEGYENVEKNLMFCKHHLKECSPIIHVGNILLTELGDPDRAEKYFKILRKSLSPKHPAIAAVYSNIGNIYRSRRALNQASKNYKISYDIRQNELPETHLHMAASHHNIGTIENEKGNYDSALLLYHKALKIKEEKSPGDTEHKGIIIRNIGVAYGNKNDFYNAFKYLFRALELFYRILPNQNLQIALCFGSIGYIHGKRGNFDVALNRYLQQLEMEEKCLPFDHPNLSLTLDSIVDTYKKMRKIEKGLELCREKLLEQKNRFGENHPCIARTSIIIGNVVKDNDFNEALRYYEEALSILESHTLPDRLIVATCLNAMACVYSDSGSLEDALRTHCKALNLQRQVLFSDHIDIASTLNMIGSCHRDMNNSSEAHHYYKESLSIYQETYGPEHQDVKKVEANIARLNLS